MGAVRQLQTKSVVFEPEISSNSESVRGYVAYGIEITAELSTDLVRMSALRKSTYMCAFAANGDFRPTVPFFAPR